MSTLRVGECVPVRIAEVDPDDEPSVAACLLVEDASIDHDLPRGLHRPLVEVLAVLRATHGISRTTQLAAVDGTDVVGTLELEVQLHENTHLAELMVHVHPEHRGAGVGTALHEAGVAAAERLRRTMLLSPVSVPHQGTQPGMAFAVARGYVSVHVEDRLELALPVAATHAPAVGGYRVITWRGACPAEHLASYALLRTRMEADVPLGEVAWTPAVFEPARVRADEERVLASAEIIAAMVLTEAGEPAGYSWLTLQLGARHAEQEDTLVMPAHRGRGLAGALKHATLVALTSEHPEREVLTTYTDPENQAMYAVNAGFGFRAVEASHEMQRALR